MSGKCRGNFWFWWLGGKPAYSVTVRCCSFDVCEHTAVVTCQSQMLSCLCRCYIDYANHRQMCMSADGLLNLTNYTLFIAELMLAHKVRTPTRPLWCLQLTPSNWTCFCFKVSLCVNTLDWVFSKFQVEQLGVNWMSGKDRDGGIVSDRLLG